MYAYIRLKGIERRVVQMDGKELERQLGRYLRMLDILEGKG